MVAVRRTADPVAAASLFTFFLANDVLSGNFAYITLRVVCVGACVASPQKLRLSVVLHVIWLVFWPIMSLVDVNVRWTELD